MLHRRDAMLRLGQLGLGALTLPGLLRAETVRQPKGTARSCILLFLWGGPPQQDMWDPKPDAPEGVKSLFAPIHTSVPGIQIGEQMPLLAKHMDQVAIVRSLTHPSDVHEPSVYHMLTGKQDNTLVVPRNSRKRSHFPNVAAIVSHFSEPGAMPASMGKRDSTCWQKAWMVSTFSPPGVSSACANRRRARGRPSAAARGPRRGGRPGDPRLGVSYRQAVSTEAGGGPGSGFTVRLVNFEGPFDLLLQPCQIHSLPRLDAGTTGRQVDSDLIDSFHLADRALCHLGKDAVAEFRERL